VTGFGSWQRQEFFLSPHPDQLWNPPIPYPMGARDKAARA